MGASCPVPVPGREMHSGAHPGASALPSRHRPCDRGAGAPRPLV
jgi:hypothetical protein